MPRPITPADLWALARVGQPEPLPDGRTAIVPVTTHDLDANKANTQLFSVDADGRTRQLTRAATSSTSPAVDPSGGRVAFLRPPSEGDEKQLYVMDLSGGEANKVTDLPLGVGPVKWLPDGSGVVAAVPLLRGHPSVDDTEEEAQRREDDPVRAVATEDRVYRFWKRWLANGRIHHLFHIDLATGAATDLTPDWNCLLSADPDPVGAFDISPDGATIAVSADITPEPHERFQFAIHLVPTAGGEIVLASAGELPAQQRRPRYRPDGEALLIGVQHEVDFYADQVRLVELAIDSRDETDLAPGWDRSASGWEWIDEAHIVLGTDDRGQTRLFRLGRGATPEPFNAPGSWHGARPASGILWCRHESSVAPPDVALIDEDGPRVVGSFNDARLADLELGKVEDIEIAGADGDAVQVRLVYPPGFDPSRPWPLVHNVHGGPHSAVTDAWHWRWNTQVFASRGYVVANVNFHGSTSWGEEFTRSIRGAWGDKPAHDILAATDHLIGLGFIDEKRMAIAGGSYGGYLVTWLTTITDRFKASICHAGVTDLLGQWASDVTAGRERAVGGVPWEDMEAVLRWSPLAHTHDITTPTLVIHGELDYRVVVTQGLSLYGVLKQKGVPARLVYYPDEGHWIETPRNSLHWYGEFLSWLDRWIGTG